MTDWYRDWFEEGRAQGARWLLVVFDARELDWEPMYRDDAARPAKEIHGTWHVEHVIDLHGSLEGQRVPLDYMP